MNKEIDYRSFGRLVIFGGVSILAAIAGIIVIVDPCFHYHSPIENLNYTLENERYQNDGILRNFSYDSVITGSSMCENFKTSEFEALFGGKCVKVPYSAGSYREIGDALKRAFEERKEIKVVVRSLDLWGGEYLLGDKDAREGAFDYPDYLYDDNWFNDVQYYLNKSCLIESLYCFANKKPLSFDEYMNWGPNALYGKEQVLSIYERSEMQLYERDMSNDIEQQIRENIQQNIISIAVENPDTEFLIFIPPYSICWWDTIKREGQLKYMIKAQRIAAEELLKYSNIQLYVFSDKIEWTANLDNYKDRVHYGEWINSEILRFMNEHNGMLTEDNYQEYFNNLEMLYLTYDYDKIYE